MLFLALILTCLSCLDLARRVQQPSMLVEAPLAPHRLAELDQSHGHESDRGQLLEGANSLLKVMLAFHPAAGFNPSPRGHHVARSPGPLDVQRRHGHHTPVMKMAAQKGRMLSKRAKGRLRGKLKDARSAQAVQARKKDKDGVQSVELLRKDYALITYGNGSQIEVHTPSLKQAQEGEWMSVRNALEITASEFAAGRDEWKYKSRDALLKEKVKPKVKQAGKDHSPPLMFGLRMEPLAINEYVRSTGNTVMRTGLHVHENLRWGASPDGLVRTTEGEDGLLEVKCFWKYRNDGSVPQVTECPPEFYDQIQGQLAVLERSWCDLVMYTSPKPDKLHENICIVRVQRDVDYFESVLRPSLDDFGQELRARRQLELQLEEDDADGADEDVTEEDMSHQPRLTDDGAEASPAIAVQLS